jgi:hypothetical protein
MDKVYALLGISMYETSMGNVFAIQAFPPDYRRSICDTFMRATHIAMNDSGLELVYHVEDKSLREVEGLPSWIPDYIVCADVLYAALHVSYNASKGMGDKFWNKTDKAKMMASATSGERTGALDFLDLRLVIIDEASELDHIISTGESIDEFLEDACGCYGWFHIMRMMDMIYLTGQRRMEVLWRILIANNFDDQCPASSDFQTWFLSWITLMLVQHKIASNDPIKSSLIKMSFQTLDFLAKADFADDWKIDWPSIKDIENLEWFWRRRDSEYIQESSGTKLLTTTWRSAQFEKALHRNPTYRLFLTICGFLGLGPKSLEIGDQVFVLGGLKAPFVLRRVESTDKDEHYNLIGTAYVHGFVCGEASTLDHFRPRRIVLE